MLISIEPLISLAYRKHPRLARLCNTRSPPDIRCIPTFYTYRWLPHLKCEQIGQQNMLSFCLTKNIKTKLKGAQMFKIYKTYFSEIISSPFISFPARFNRRYCGATVTAVT